MKMIADDLKVSGLSQNSENFSDAQYEICQLVAFDADNLAKSIIGAKDAGNNENVGNNNTLVYLGLAGLFPKPTAVIPREFPESLRDGRC